MKSTINKFYPLILFLLAHLSLHAQYSGGNSDGNSQDTLINNVCATPASFYAYIGGSGDGNSVQTIISSVCGTPPGGYAYLGGSGDGNSVNTISTTTCGLPPGAYAYTGGSGDGQGLQTTMTQICPYPPHFYAYFGGNGDGSAMEKNRNCAIVMPVADFTGVPTEICVNQNVTFTDASTNAVGWEWTVTGGTFVSASTMYSQNPVVRYATAGTYTVTLKARNHDGDDIITKTTYIKVNATATISATAPGSRCGAGSVTISATPNSGTIKWYDAATGGTLLFTGNSYTTPSIAITTIYYAEAYNGCTASSRTAVTATINSIPTISGNTASRCDAGTVTISANPSTGTVTWYDTPTGGTLLSTGAVYTTPSINISTTYYAETLSAQGCVSTRIPVVATVNTTPTVTSTTPASRCGGGSLLLNATVSAGVLNWYDAATGGTYLGTTTSFATPTLSASQSYFVEASNNGCTSPRIEVVATINTIPTITGTTPSSRCSSGTVTLGATGSSGTINWYDAPTGGVLVGTGASFTTPSISTSTTYYVEVTNGTCTSARTAITATVNTTAAPIGNANQTYCGSETVGLIIASGTNIIWYDAASGGNVVPNNTPIVSGTTYYASQTISSCESSSRLAVTMTSGSCLGIDDFDTTYLKVYPNPVMDRLTIENGSNLSRVEVFNLAGQILFTATLNTTETTIDMSRFASATYLVKIYDTNNKTKTMKIVKQ